MARLKIKTLEPIALHNTAKTKKALADLQTLLEMFKDRVELIEKKDNISFELDFSVQATYERVQEVLVALRLLVSNAKTVQKIRIDLDLKKSTMWVGPPSKVLEAQKAENYKIAIEAVVRLSQTQKEKLVKELALI